MIGDEVVVRNYKKILAFFTVHFADHPIGVREVLALPEFSGPKADEKIQWTTELFETTPVKLSSLKGEERTHYQSILQEALDDVRDMVALLPQGVSSMLHKAVTYHSDDNVYCAEDKVVITEWGMYPKGLPNIHTLALEKAKMPRFGPCANGDRVVSEVTPEPVLVDPEPTVPEEPGQSAVEDSEASVGYMPQAMEPEPDVQQPEEEQPPVEEPPVDNKDDGEKKKKKRWWLWLLLLIPVLLLLLLLRRCDDEDITILPPPVNEEDIGWDGDTLTKIVNNRLILLFSADRPVKEFVKDFRKLYPDKKAYQLYAPDMDNDLPRLILTLPKEELESVAKRLPDEFAAYDLMVIPEAVFEGGKTFSDPAFGDRKKTWYFEMISAQMAWDYTIGSPDVIVAIIDDGFDLNHPELKGKEIVKPYNAINHNSKVFPDSNSGHGTHVASTAVGSANNGEGSCGIAPECKLMPIQVGNEKGIMTTSSVVDGVLYAIKNGANIINMSLGQEFNPLIAMLPDEVQEEIIKTQFKTEEKMWNKIFGMGMKNGKDIAFVLAGGNQGILIGLDPMQRVDGVINVSAVEPNKKRAYFSNYGDYSTLSAPGVSIYNAVSGNKKYDSYDGTSMASPIVAGAFALMKSAYPYKSVKEIKELLQHTGIPSPSKVGNIINFAYAFAYLEGNDKNHPIHTDPVTGNPVPTDPQTSNPIYMDPVTGDPAPTDPKTGNPIYTDPVTGKPTPTDPVTGKPIYKDPVTGKPVQTDPITGQPIYNDPVTGQPVQADPGTGKPIYTDPITGQPVQTDPQTGKPIYTDPKTGKPIKNDPVTGKPIYTDPKTGKPIPTDPITGKPVQNDPMTGKPVYNDPVTGKPVPTDPKTGKPIYIDPTTGKPTPTDSKTGKPIYNDPVTGQPVQTDPNTGKPIYNDPITGKPVQIDPTTGKPIYNDPITGKPIPTDPTTGKPIYKDPTTGKPIITNPTTPTDPDCPDCTEARRLYEELMRQLDELKRQNPECY